MPPRNSPVKRKRKQIRDEFCYSELLSFLPGAICCIRDASGVVIAGGGPKAGADVSRTPIRLYGTKMRCWTASISLQLAKVILRVSVALYRRRLLLRRDLRMALSLADVLNKAALTLAFKAKLQRARRIV